MNAYFLILVFVLLVVLGLGILVAIKRRRLGRGLFVLPLDNIYQATYRGILSDQESQIWQETLLEQIDCLKEIGWPDRSIQLAYLSELDVPEDHSHHLSYLNQRLMDAQIFGSAIFQKMWRLSSYQENPFLSRQLWQMTMTFFSMPEDLSGELGETQRLLAKFAPDLEPASTFWHIISQTVQLAFPGDSLVRGGLLERQVHQFRYLISCQQAQWIRDYFRKEGKSDAVALAAYIRNLAERKRLMQDLGRDDYKSYYAYELTESSRLHNKLAMIGKEDGQVYRSHPINLKVLLGFHTEFILDEAGSFLNELDCEGISENGLANGASFNYADRNNSRHRALDIAPVKRHDPVFRQDLLKKGQYVIPNRVKNSQMKEWYFSYFNKEGYFAYQGQSAMQRVTDLQRAFEELLKEGD